MFQCFFVYEKDGHTSSFERMSFSSTAIVCPSPCMTVKLLLPDTASDKANTKSPYKLVMGSKRTLTRTYIKIDADTREAETGARFAHDQPRLTLILFLASLEPINPLMKSEPVTVELEARTGIIPRWKTEREPGLA
ncbi:hypothetical protein Tcan_12281 [Toxocara canis]|uniref:Uncharacterized protein n=1 Tax=Toxocara canis TaxID=6265 RepID=A0A0B2VFX6_TOXCA|nr:hypothetical protein Tcan_12281 [Toxocara canis]